MSFVEVFRTVIRHLHVEIYAADLGFGMSSGSSQNHVQAVRAYAKSSIGGKNPHSQQVQMANTVLSFESATYCSDGNVIVVNEFAKVLNLG